MNQHPAPRPGSDGRHAFGLDLTVDEIRRREAFLAAMGEDWDPMAVLEGEREAYRLLYSGLSAEQEATYRALADAGVLPARDDEEGGRAAH